MLHPHTVTVLSDPTFKLQLLVFRYVLCKSSVQTPVNPLRMHHLSGLPISYNLSLKQSLGPKEQTGASCKVQKMGSTVWVNWRLATAYRLLGNANTLIQRALVMPCDQRQASHKYPTHLDYGVGSLRLCKPISASEACPQRSRAVMTINS